MAMCNARSWLDSKHKVANEGAADCWGRRAIKLVICSESCGFFLQSAKQSGLE